MSPIIAADPVQRAGALARQFAAVAADVDRSGRFPYEHVDAIRSAGLLGLAVPTSLGGAALGLAACAEVLRTLARGDGGTALGLAMHLMVTGSVSHGGEEWPAATWESLAHGAVAGGVIINRVASEAEGGSPARGGLPKTVLEPAPDGWLLTGRKDWATWAPVLSHGLVTARIDGEGGPSMAQVLVPMSADGVERVAESGGVGLRSAGNGSLVFERVRLGRDAVLSTGQGGPPPGRSPAVIAWFQLCVASVYVGIAESARDTAGDFARNRRPNDRDEPISAIPAVRLRLGRMEADVRAAWLLVRAAAELVDRARDGGAGLCSADVAIAKVQATQLAWSVCEQALRLAGGGALQGDALPFERLARDVRGGLVHPPTEDGLHMDLGKAVAQA